MKNLLSTLVLFSVPAAFGKGTAPKADAKPEKANAGH